MSRNARAKLPRLSAGTSSRTRRVTSTGAVFRYRLPGPVRHARLAHALAARAGTCAAAGRWGGTRTWSAWDPGDVSSSLRGSPVGTASGSKSTPDYCTCQQYWWQSRSFLRRFREGRRRSVRRRNIAPLNGGCRQVAERGEGSAPGRPSRSADFETGDVQIGRHQHRWLIHALSTADVPLSQSSRRWARGGQAERAFHREDPIPTEPGVVRISTPQANEKGDVRVRVAPASVAYPRLVHGDGPPASRVAVGEGWISRTGVFIERDPIPTGPGVVRIRTLRQMKRAMFGSSRHQRRRRIHASSTATVPSAIRVAVGEGWISRTGVHREDAIPPNPGSYAPATRQLNGAMFDPNTTQRRRAERLRGKPRRRRRERGIPSARSSGGVTHPCPPRLFVCRGDRRRGQSVDNPVNAVPLIERGVSFHVAGV